MSTLEATISMLEATTAAFNGCPKFKVLLTSLPEGARISYYQLYAASMPYAL